MPNMLISSYSFVNVFFCWSNTSYSTTSQQKLGTNFNLTLKIHAHVIVALRLGIYFFTFHYNMAINCNQLCYSTKKLIKQMNVLTVIGYIKTIMKNMTFMFKKSQIKWAHHTPCTLLIIYHSFQNMINQNTY